MSQRVQKGSTVFRPVAKPRPRTGGGSRQSSVLPESATPGPSNLRNSQDGPPRAPSAMPPPSSIPQRPSADPFPSPHPVAAITPTGDVNIIEAPSTQPGSMAGPSAPPTQPPAARIVPMPSRMPPRIDASQPPSSQSGVAISMPSRTMTRAPTLPPAPTPIVPVAPSHPGPSYSAEQLPFLPQNVGIMNGPPSSVPYTIDSSQIDPLLMGPSAFAGFTHLQRQDNSPGELSAEPRLDVGLSDVPAARPRRTQRKKSDTAKATAVEGGDQDDAEGDDAAPKKKRTRKAAAEGDQNSSPAGSRKRKRSETAEPRRSRKRAPSPPPFDAEADPGEELDPTAITMAALCDDNGRGRVSSKAAQIVSNHAAWRASNRDKRARMKAAMEAKKYGRDTEEEDGATRSASQKPAEPDASGSASRAASVALDVNAPDLAADEDEEPAEKGVDGFDYGADMAVSRFNVQVRIGANGETIIDEQSLFVNRDEEHQTDDYTHVEESDFTKFVNSATYSKKLRGSRWSAEETELFYDALSQFGENYELISYVLPGRDRKACKNKFKAEDKKNSARITYCLNNRTPYDIETLSRMTGKDFSGPTPEIRAPTPLRSTELEPASELPAHSSTRAIRKKSRTPSAAEAGVEIVGDIDEVEKEDFQQIGPDGTLIGV